MPAPRQNLPLPREVRDQIYSLLVSAGSVRQEQTDPEDEEDVAAWRDLPMNTPYSFPTGIMAVNSTIGQEAAEVFYENTFILIQSASRWLGELVRAFQVPLVKHDAQCERLLTEHWNMELEIVIPSSSVDVKADSRCYHQFIIVLKDLPLFCTALKWAFFGYEQTAHRYLPASMDSRLFCLPQYKSLGRASLHIHFRSLESDGTNGNVHRPFDPELQSRLLTPLKECICAELDLRVIGAVTGDEKVANDLRSIMAPKRIWMAAMAWDLLDAMVKVKAHSLVDDLYMRGRHIQVYNLCRCIAEQMRTCALHRIMQEPWYRSDDVEALQPEFVSSFTEPIGRATGIEMDILSYGLAAGLRAPKLETNLRAVKRWAEWTANCLGEWMEQGLAWEQRTAHFAPLPVIDGVPTSTDRLSLHYVYRTLRMLREWDDMLFDELQPCIPTLEECAEKNPDRPRIRHDVNVMAATFAEFPTLPYPPSTLAQQRKVKEFISKLSINALEKFSFKEASMYSYTKPAHMKGWVDDIEQWRMRQRELVVITTGDSSHGRGYESDHASDLDEPEEYQDYDEGKEEGPRDQWRIGDAQRSWAEESSTIIRGEPPPAYLRTMFETHRPW